MNATVHPMERPFTRQRDHAGAAPSWLESCICDTYGRPIPNLANALTALREDPALIDVVAFDQMASLPMLMRRMPEAGKPGAACEPRPLTDQDGSALQEYLQRVGLPRIPRDTVFQALDKRAHDRAFHPVRDYLSSLIWDGRARLESWLSTYLGTEASAYSSAVGGMFLIAMVARILKPGCKADYLIVLEGPQGAQKSTACSILAGRWFSDSLPEIGQSKEAASHLAGKWLIEVGEMHAMNKAEATHLKAFITRTTERYRPAYGRQEIVQERQCVFIATTNESSYLKDATGGRRFWPVKVGMIDLKALERDRDQLFAEAMLAYLDGRPWWPDSAFEREHIAPQQEDRFATDPWEQAIVQFFDTRPKATVSEIARLALGFDTTAKIGTADANRIRAVLQSLGMVQLKKDGDGNRPWTRP